MDETLIRIHPECVFEFFEDHSQVFVVCSNHLQEAFVFTSSALSIWQSLSRVFQRTSDVVDEIAMNTGQDVEQVQNDVKYFFGVLTEIRLVEFDKI